MNKRIITLLGRSSTFWRSEQIIHKSILSRSISRYNMQIQSQQFCVRLVQYIHSDQAYSHIEHVGNVFSFATFELQKFQTRRNDICIHSSIFYICDRSSGIQRLHGAQDCWVRLRIFTSVCGRGTTVFVSKRLDRRPAFTKMRRVSPVSHCPVLTRASQLDLIAPPSGTNFWQQAGFITCPLKRHWPAHGSSGLLHVRCGSKRQNRWRRRGASFVAASARLRNSARVSRPREVRWHPSPSGRPGLVGGWGTSEHKATACDFFGALRWGKGTVRPHRRGR